MQPHISQTMMLPKVLGTELHLHVMMPNRSSRSFLGGEEEVASYLDLPPIPGPDAMRAQAEARARATVDGRRRKRVNDLLQLSSSPLAIRDMIFNGKCC